MVRVECLLPGDRVTNRDDGVHLLPNHEPDLGDRPKAVRAAAVLVGSLQLGLGGVTHAPEEADVNKT